MEMLDYSFTVRIGVIHSYYRSEFPSGENLTVDAIVKILRDLGHEVSIWSFNSDLIVYSKVAQIKQALEICFLRKNNDAFNKWVSEQDAIQIHNYFPGITFSNLKTLLKSHHKITRVIHNYRKTCIRGSHYRENSECSLCSRFRKFPGVALRCYNNRAISSFFVSQYTKKIESFESAVEIEYIAISETVANYLEGVGILQPKIHIIPNSVSAAKSISRKATDCVYFGRIESEKGIYYLLEMWKHNPDLPRLHIIGSGSKLRAIEILANPLPNVVIHGAKYGKELEQILQKCKVSIFPAQWKEPFGRTVVESLARGQAIAISNNYSRLNAVKEGINGSSFEMQGEEFIMAVKKCVSLDIEIQIRESQKIWQDLYSPEAVAEFWKDYYLKIEQINL